jgi:hypothetical protein
MARQVIMILKLQILGTQIFIYVIDYMQVVFREVNGGEVIKLTDVS